MNPQENIPVHIKRRIHLIDKVIDNLLPNMYPCDYNSSDHFVEGVLDEIFYFFRAEPDFYGIDLISINDFILDHKYDELTNYFNEHCIVLKNDNLQESIKRILREESKLSPLIRRRVPQDDLEREFKESLEMATNMLFNLNNNGGGIMTLDRFIVVTISILIDGIHHDLYSTIRPEKEWYNEVKESLKDYYRDRIEDRYLKLTSKM